MPEIVHADIFFFITSIAVICVTAGILVILYYLIPVVRDLRAIVARLRHASEEAERDFEALRATLRQEGTKGKLIVDMVLKFLTTLLPTPRKPRAKKTPDSSSEV